MEQTAGVLQLAQETIEMKIICIFLSAAALIHSAELPPKAQPGQGALLSAGFIYPLENRPTPQLASHGSARHRNLLQVHHYVK